MTYMDYVTALTALSTARRVYLGYWASDPSRFWAKELELVNDAQARMQAEFDRFYISNHFAMEGKARV